MRALKTIGLVVIAALASMAFMGASSASAETLCLENVGHENECPEVSRWTGDVAWLAKGATFLSGGGEFSCNLALLGLFNSNEGAHTGLKYLLDSLTLSNCEGQCTGAKGHSAPFWLLAQASKFEGVGLHALVWGDEPESLLFGMLFEGCTIFKINCLYETEDHIALFEIENDLLIANELPLARSTNAGHSALCAASLSLDAKFLMVEHSEGEHGEPLYLAALP